MKKIILLIALIATAAVFAQAPYKMSYQAVVRDAGGDLLTDTTIGMQISILESSATGTPVYVETQTPITNTNGLLSIIIGDGVIVSGSIPGINWESGPFFLKTEIDPAGGTAYSIEATSQLLSVPFALLSKDTENKNSLDAAYDEDGPGLGRTIIADSGPIEIVAIDDWGLEIVADPDWTGLYVSGVTDPAHTAIYAEASGDARSVWADNNGTGSALYAFHGGAGNGLSISHGGTGTGIFIDNGGTGEALNIFNGNPANVKDVIVATNMGTGSVAFFNTDDNNANVKPTLAANNSGAGSAAEFTITDEVVGKVNGMPAVTVVSNGKGTGLNISIINAAMGGDANTEPALSAKHDGLGNGAFLETPKSENTAATLEIKNNGSGHGAHIDSFGNPGVNVEATLYVEQANSSTVTTMGRTAVFDLHPAVTSADSAVLIRSSSIFVGSSALRVIPASLAQLAAVFEGDVEVARNITIGGLMSAAAKAFKIDHPLDPANKFLIHNSIESNERINIYSGNIKTNTEGYATVELPDYMCALNKDFKYQLTILDKTFARAIIWEGIDTETNSFTIKTDTPEIMVSWQVTGTRQDTWALENPMKVEVDKITEF